MASGVRLWQTYQGGPGSGGAIVGETLAVKNFRSKVLGNTLGLEPETITHTQWLDSSGHGHHALLPEEGATLLRPKSHGEIRWTNTWKNTHEAQYVGGANQDILPLNAYITDIIGVIEGEAITDIIVGDDSDN